MSQLTFTLNDGNKIPFLAFGTGTSFGSRDVTEPVTLAIEKGFTHLDGAQVRVHDYRLVGPVLKVGIQSYRNEDSLGAAIRGSGKPRDLFFVTTKLSSPIAPGETVSDGLRRSLDRLGLGALRSASQHTEMIDALH